IASRGIRIRGEFPAQMRKILEAGIAPTHIDTHKHTHLAPPVLDAVARIAEEFGVVWVRRPFDLPITAARGDASWVTKATTGGLEFLRSRFHRVLADHNCRTTDHFPGFHLTGRFRTAELI